MIRKLYIKVTRDKYQLPVAVADNTAELAKMVGTTKTSVDSSISHNTGTYFRVIIDDEDDE